MALNSDQAKLIAQLVLEDKLSPSVAQALRSLDKLDRGVGRTQKSLGRMGKGAGQIGLGLARVGAVAAGAVAVGLGAATKAAADFEDAFAGVKKTVDEADLAAAKITFKDLEKGFVDLSTKIPITAAELARLGEAAGALGVGVKDINLFAEVTAKLGATTNLTADEAAASLGKIGTVLDLTGQDYKTFADALVNLGNKGASTEAEIIEITKRFAAAGKSAGLSTVQILGFASAIASAGVEPEAAGSSLSRLFGNLVKETALGTDKAEAFAKVSGKSFKDFSKIVEQDTNKAMLLFLKSLGKLDKFDQAKALEAVGITGVRDINAIRLLAQTYEKNLIPALNTARDSAGALDEESTKKFDTLKQKFQLLKNAFVKGGIEMGEGFLPALGRLTTKVTTWVNTNSGKLQQVGRDIGKALDDIDWSEVERGAMKVADAAKVILDVVKQIPTEVKLGGLAFLGLDKASGGLLGKGLGNVGGGAVDLFAKQFLARGSSPANPVWVAGVGGGLPGAAGTAAGAAAAGIGARALLAGSAAAGVVVVLQEASKEAAKAFNTEFSKIDIAANFQGGLVGPQGILPAIQNLAEVVRVFGELNKPKPKPTGDHEGAGQRRPFVPMNPRGAAPDVREWRSNKDTKVVTAVERLKSEIGPSLSRTPVKLANIETKVASAGIASALAAKNAGDRGVSAALTNASLITAAIRANRPIINVDSRTIIDSRTYNSAINRETTYINGGYNGGAPQGGR